MKRKFKWKFLQNNGFVMWLFIFILLTVLCKNSVFSGEDKATLENNTELKAWDVLKNKLASNFSRKTSQLFKKYPLVIETIGNNFTDLVLKPASDNYENNTKRSITSDKIKLRLSKTKEKSVIKKMCTLWKKYKSDQMPEYVNNLISEVKSNAREGMLRKLSIKKPSKHPRIFSTNDEGLPPGCNYKDYNIQTQTIICSGSDIKTVPMFLIRNINTLIFNRTEIQIVDREAALNLPSAKELQFIDGVLMDFSFYDLLLHQKFLEKLSVVENSISTVSFSAFSLPSQLEESLLELNFESNRIVFLPEPTNTNATVLPKLEIINFSNNPMCVIPGDLFFPLRSSNVSKLYLSMSGIEDIGSPTLIGNSSPLEYLPKLEVLDLSHNQYLSPSLLAKFLFPLIRGNLRNLNLSFNFYIEIPRTALKYVHHSLENLKLDYSSFTCLDETSFPKMPVLKILHLKYSRIAKINPRAFQRMPSLEELNLDGNALTTVSPGFKTFNLLRLSLKDNPSGVSKDESFILENSTFEEFPNLQELDMTNVPLKHIDVLFFKNLFSLNNLILNGCKLQDIAAFSFRDLTSLINLDLSNNELSTLDEDVFTGLRNLKYLDLSNNEIRFEHANFTHYLNDKDTTLFAKALQLELLDLSSNQITRFREGMFDHLKNLKELYADGNQIYSWNKPIFQYNDHLLILILSDNSLHQFTDGMITDFAKVNLTVNLSENDFVCSCSMTALETELNSTIFLDQESYHCFTRNGSYTIDEYLASFNTTECTDYYNPLLPKSKSPIEYTINNITIIVSVIVLLIITAGLLVLTYRNRWYPSYIIYKLKVKTQYMNYRPDSTPYQFDTFICYAQNDRQWVYLNLVKKLETSNGGMNLCLHERDFVVGAEITYNILRSVEMSRKVIVVLSKYFVESSWCMYELQVASNKILDEKKNKLILVLKEPISSEEQPKELKSLFKTKTYITWKPDDAVFWDRLLKVLAKPTNLKNKTISESSCQTESESEIFTIDIEKYDYNGQNYTNNNNNSIQNLINPTENRYVNPSFSDWEECSVENLDSHLYSSSQHRETQA